MPNFRSGMSLFCFPLTRQNAREIHFLSQLYPIVTPAISRHIRPVAFHNCILTCLAKRTEKPYVFSLTTHGDFYSNLRISTGRMRAADRAGSKVAPMLIASAAAAIHSESNPFAWKGT